MLRDKKQIETALQEIKNYLNYSKDYSSGVFLFSKYSGKKATSNSLYNHPDENKLKNYLLDLLKQLQDKINDVNTNLQIIENPISAKLTVENIEKAEKSITTININKNTSEIDLLKDKAKGYYKLYGNAHSKLKVVNSEPHRLELAKEIIKNITESKKIYNQIDYYKLNGELPISKSSKIISNENFEDAIKLQKEYNRLSTQMRRLKLKINGLDPMKDDALIKKLNIEHGEIKNKRELVKRTINKSEAKTDSTPG